MRVAFSLLCTMVFPRRYISATPARRTGSHLFGAIRGGAASAQLDALAVHFAAVALAPGGEIDFIAAHAAFQRVSLAFGAQAAGEHLILLLERELALRQRVGAGDLRRHDPEERGAPGHGAAGVRAELGFLVFLPVAHRQAVPTDPG